MKKIIGLILLVSGLAHAQPTYFGNDSNLRTLVNLATRSEEIDNAGTWANTVGGTATTPTVTANHAIAPDGTLTAERLQLSLGGGTTTNDIARRGQSILGLSAGLTYRSCFWARSTDGTSTYRMHYLTNAGTTTNFDVTPTYTETCVDSVPSGGLTGTVTIGLRGGQAPANTNTVDILFWGARFHLLSSPNVYVRTTDRQVTEGLTNTTAQVPLSNLILRSEEFDNASWTKSASTVTANSSVAPNGTTTADSIIEDSATAYHEARQVISVNIGYTYRYQVHVRSLTRTFSTISVYGTPSGSRAVNIDLSTCATAAVATGGWSTFATVTSTLTPQGYCDVTVLYAATSSGTVTHTVGPAIASGGQTTYAGNGTSGIIAWGAQLNLVANPSDYVPTTTAAVTTSPLCPAGTTQSINDPSRCFALSSLPILPINGITADVLDTTAVNEIRDSILSRPLEDNYSTNTFGWIIDRIRKYTSNRMTKSGNSYTIYKDDKTTVYESGTTTGGERAVP